MRRIMMDATRDGAVRQLVDRPAAEGYVLKIPEPDGDNVGPTGFVGVAERVRSRQEIRIKVSNSGDYVASIATRLGAKFVFNLDYLRDEDGDDIVDGTPEQRAQNGYTPHHQQCLVQNSALVHTSPRMTELKRWGNADPGYGYLGLLGVCTRDTGTNAHAVLMWRMKECGPDAVNVGYEWETVAHDLPGWTNTIAHPSDLDLVELDDGSIVLAVSRNEKIYTYRSFDCGDTWEDTQSSFDVVLAGRTCVALGRIGGRLVVVYADVVGGTHNIYSRYSDDNGGDWSAATSIHIDAANAPDEAYVELLLRQDGSLLLAAIFDDTAAVGGANEVGFDDTYDGVSWTGGGSLHYIGAGLAATNASMIWEYWTREPIYHVLGGELRWVAYDTAPVKVVAQDADDTDGMSAYEICARTFSRDTFTDLVSVFKDTHPANDSYGVTVHRLCKWSMSQLVPFEDFRTRAFYSCWSAYCYPNATADPHPNLNHWARTQVGAGASALQAAEYGRLKITSGAAADMLTYNQALANDSFDNGMFALFTLLVASGYAHVTVQTCSNPSNADGLFSVVFDQANNQIILYDHRAGAQVTAYTPTNWRVDEWNEYVLVAKDDGGGTLQVVLSRAPFERYKEISHGEIVFAEPGLQVNPPGYTANNDKFTWGVDANNPGGAGASDCRWKSVHLNTDWYDTTTPNLAGKKCYTNPVGIMQGIACRWTGEHAVAGDEWDFDVGAQFDADNIFVDSPRVCFSDPEDAAARVGSIVIDWRRHEGDEATCMNYMFDSIAVFGLNTPLFQIEGGNFAGAGWTTLWCNTHGIRGGPVIYEPSLVVDGTPDQNVIAVGAGTSNLDSEFVPNQFASTRWRKWYVIFIGGACNWNAYRIDGNSATELFLESNVEADGVLDGDSFIVFADRFLHVFDQVFTYPRIRMTLAVNNFVPPPSENAVRVGTVVLGQTYDLPDDEWESVITTESGVEVTKGRSRMDRWRETAPERRSIGLSYTGRIDRGMGSDVVRELYRHARWGVHPVVWIDDDTALVESSGTCLVASEMSHVDPILARVGGPMTQRRKFYSYEQQDGGLHVRGAHDVGGVTLEEVL